MSVTPAFLAPAGFVYVANTPAYLAEALLSIASLRQCIPDARVCLIAPPEIWQKDSPVDDWIAPTLSDRTPIVKNDAIRAPYERIVFLDTDTMVIGDLRPMFGVLDRFDIAAAHEPTRGWDYETEVPLPFCELNTGMLVFRNSAKMSAFFAAWLRKYRELQDQAGLANDQPSFRSTLWNSPEVRLATLPPEFHCIPGKPVALAWEARLLHDRRGLDFVSGEINRRLGYRTFAPGLGLIFPFQGRRLWITTWLRATLNWFKVLLRPSSMQQLRTTSPHQWHLAPEKKKPPSA